MKTFNKKLILLLSIPTSLIASSCMHQFSESVTDKNTGINGSFESIENNLPVNWLFYTSQTTPTGDFDIMLDTVEARDGKQSVCFQVRECSSEGGRFSPGLAQEFPTHPGETYKVSFWIKNRNSEFVVKINGVSTKHAAEGIVSQSSETIDTWRLVEYQYTIPQHMDKLRIEVNILRPGNFWIDDIKIDKVG